MREIVRFSPNDVTPSIEAVLEAQGVPVDTCANESILALAQSAVSIYHDFAQPVGILSRISQPDFARVYHGEGRNDDDTPLASIYPKADSLALFAVTVGEAVCAEINRLFETNDFALGSMLDATASEGAELAARAITSHVCKILMSQGRLTDSMGVLEFSPGYCGWHMTGQKKLFESLRPEEIGITLNDSCLMQPLKSVSGVIITGPKEALVFEDSFPVCDHCQTHSCRDRIRIGLGR
jgi:hypothetical protein